MTLPVSGAISMSQVNTELNLAATTPISLNQASVRTLFNKPSGIISMSDGHGKSNFTAAYLQSASINSQQSSYTFAAQNLGAAASSRMIVVAVMSTTTVSAVSSCTIGGVTATKLKEQVAALSNHYQLATIYGAMVPNGTTGDVVVGFSQNQFSCAVSVYRLTGKTSATAVTTNSTATASPYTTTLNIPENGFVVGCVSINNPGSSTSWTVGLSKDYDVASTGRFSSANASFANAVTGQTITATNASGTDAGAFVVASFGAG